MFLRPVPGVIFIGKIGMDQAAQDKRVGNLWSLELRVHFFDRWYVEADPVVGNQLVCTFEQIDAQRDRVLEKGVHLIGVDILSDDAVYLG